MGALEVSAAQVGGTRRWTGCYHSIFRGLGSTAPCLCFPSVTQAWQLGGVMVQSPRQYSHGMC